MRGWFRPRCPLDTWEQTWVEWWLRWLTDRLGPETLLRAEVLLPIAEHFPEPFLGTTADAQWVLARLCGRMGLDPDSVSLDVCDDRLMGDAAGLYDPSAGDRPVIRLARSQLDQPAQLVATLAHELAHELLARRNLISPDARDFEWVTDLTPVVFGLGVFAANSTVTDSYVSGAKIGGWSVRKHGYLSSRVFGYAFALFAFARGETAPDWARHLRPDAHEPMRSGLRYLKSGGDTVFRPESLREPRARRPPAETARWLRAGSASARLATLWDLGEDLARPPDLVPEIARCLADTDPAVPPEAALALAGFGPAALPAVPALLEALTSPDDTTRACVALTLGRLGARPEVVVPALADRLDDPCADVREHAAAALVPFGRASEPAVPRLLDALRAAAVACDYPFLDTLTAALRAATDDPVGRADRFFDGDDPELRRITLALLSDPAEEDPGADTPLQGSRC